MPDQKTNEQYMATYKEFTLELAHSVKPFSKLHGHTFVARLQFTGPLDPEFGWVVNLYDVTQHIQALKNHIAKAGGNVDADEHGNGEGEGNLDLIPEIGPCSIENVAIWMWKFFKPKFPELEEIDLNRGFRGSIEGCIYRGQ